MAILSNLNRKNIVSLLDSGGGSTKKTTPTYGSYVAGGSSTPSVPTPVTLPSYSAGLIGQPTVPVSPVGNTLQMPNMNFNSNVVQVGAAQNKGNSGGVTDEGVVIGGGATPLPQIKSGSSSGSGSSGSSGASTYGSWLQNVVGSFGSKVTGAANSVANAAQNAANNQKTTLVHNPNDPVKKTTLPAQAGQSAEKTLFSDTGASAGSGDAATEQKTYTSAWAGSEPIDSYEEFLRNKETAYGSMRDQQTQFYDEQSQKTLAAIEAQHQAAISEAENQKNLLVNMSEEQRNAVYAFAEEQRIADMDYAAQQYQLLLDSINAQRESGMAMATEQRDLLLSMSEEQRNSIYAAAESQRVAAEKRADVERERGVVDARSSYEQNKAFYGANAETMGSMGLSGSGYSDYLNSKAYAQQRAETQAANAQADASKREARYAEDQARMQADSDYYQNKYNAEQAYSDRKYQIDTTYQSNLLNANQSKAQAEHEATSTERETKLSADQTHAQNEYSAESSYSDNLFKAESQARSDKLTAEQTADAGKFSAEMSYQQNLLENDDAIGKHRLDQEQKAEAEAKQAAADAEEKASYARAAYTELLSGANSGAYTAAQLEQLAADYGLSDAQKQSLINAANDYTTKKQAAADAEIAAGSGDSMGAIDSAAQAGTISQEQAAAQKAQVQSQNYESYASEVSYGNADTSAIDRAYQKGDISESQYNSLKTQWNDNIDTSADFFYANNTMLTKSAAQKALNNLTKNSWCSSSVKSALQAEFNKLYTPTVNGSNKNASDKELADAGNNFKVTLNGKNYCVESAGECTDTNVKEVASDVGNGSMFGYQGHVYIKSNGKIYEIRKRKNSYQSDWNTVYAALCG